MRSFVRTLLLLIGTLGVVGIASAATPEALTTACQDGDAEACGALAGLYYDGRTVTQDYFKAGEFYRQACDGQDMTKCSILGYMYERGYGFKQDYVKAVELYRQTCDKQDSTGCALLGLVYEYGTGVPQSREDALTFYGKSCDLNNEKGCEGFARVNAGKRYFDAKGANSTTVTHGYTWSRGHRACGDT